MAQQTFRVNNAAGMWLRTAPKAEKSTEKVLLPHGQLVTKLGEAGKSDWWFVATNYQGAYLPGFGNNLLLVADAESAPSPEPGSFTSTTSQLQDKLTEAEIKKTKLETDYLEHPWKDFAKYLSLLTSFVAVVGLVLTSYRSEATNARNESLSRAQHIQAQIRADKDQLINFITDKNFSTARGCVFVGRP